MFDTYAQIFTRRADSYQAAMARRPHARRAEFESVLAPLALSAGALVCDMPSGGGYLSAWLPDGARYLAIEPSELFFASCPQGDRAERIRAPIADVPLPAGSVDHVVSLAGLHHEQDLLAIFREMRRLVRPGGRIVIADVAVDTPPARFLNTYVAANCPQGHDGRFLDGETARLAEAAGLTILDDRLTPVPWMFDDAEDAGRFCGALFGLSGADPLTVADALARDVGLDEENGQVGLRWVLRRIVCVAGAG